MARLPAGTRPRGGPPRQDQARIEAAEVGESRSETDRADPVFGRAVQFDHPFASQSAGNRYRREVLAGVPDGNFVQAPGILGGTPGVPLRQQRTQAFFQYLRGDAVGS